MNETPLINRAKVKELALACAQNRARKFSRVSGDFLLAANAHLRAFVNDRVASHPSKGVTLK